MDKTAAQQELLDFLEEYRSFFQQMEQSERDKLEALVSNELPRIEHAISIAQANTKRLENLEQRRAQLQERAGLADLTFSQLTEQLPEHRRTLTELFGRIQACVEEIKFYNTKSMEVAKTNLMRINPDALRMQDTGHSQPYGYAKEQLTKRISMLETKI